MNDQNKIQRMIDANLNRSREGLRVVEDILRFVYNDHTLSSRSRQLRHTLSIDNKISSRQSSDDIGSAFDPKNKKDDIYGLIRANMRRAQEAVRVLEESQKLIDQQIDFQSIRFELYELERLIIKEYFADA